MVEGLALGEGPSRGGRGVEAGGVRVLSGLIGQAAPAVGAEGHVGGVDGAAQGRKLLIERRLHDDGALVLIDRRELAIGETGDLLPPRGDVVGSGPAVDRVDHDALGDQRPAHVAKRHFPILIRRLVAGHHDELEGVVGRIPVELIGVLEDTTDVFLPAVGGEGKELLGDDVEIVGERAVHPHPSVLGVVPVVAEGQQRHPQPGRRLGDGQLVDDRPQLLLGRVDQTAHAPARVQADGQIDRPRLGDLLRRLPRASGLRLSEHSEDRGQPERADDVERLVPIHFHAP